jgi:hypothetical protein
MHLDFALNPADYDDNDIDGDDSPHVAHPAAVVLSGV